jgi:hypothetical protein
MLFSERLNIVKGFEVWCFEVRQKEGFDIAHTPLGIVSYLDSKGMLSPCKVEHNSNSASLELGTAPNSDYTPCLCEYRHVVDPGHGTKWVRKQTTACKVDHSRM